MQLFENVLIYVSFCQYGFLFFFWAEMAMIGIVKIDGDSLLYCIIYIYIYIQLDGQLRATHIN